MFQPEPNELPDGLPNPANTNQLELLALCEQFLRTASPTVHKELHDFLITRGHHHICGMSAFLDQLTFTLARSHQPGGAE